MTTPRSCFHPGPAALLAALLVGGCGNGPGDETPEELAGGFPAGLQPYAVQMHIHGHSHHNGDPRPGSMQWHSHFASETGLDVLWWSDHSTVFDLSFPLDLDFGNRNAGRVMNRLERRQAGHLASEGLVLGLARAPAEDAEWVARRHVSQGHRRTLVARSKSGTERFQETVYQVARPNGLRPKGFLLSRPVSSAAVLEVDLDPGDLGQDVQVEVQVSLSWHHRGAPRRHLLRYFLVPAAEEAARASPQPGVALVSVPVSAGRTRLSLDLEADAGLLRDGRDNTVTGVAIRLAARRGAEVAIDVFDLKLSSRSPQPDHQLAQIHRFAERYSAEYGHEQHVGVEFLTGGPESVHINAFLPAGALTGELASGDEATWDDPAEFVQRVQLLGGVTSYNHLFGTTTGRGQPPREQRRSRRRALELLATGAYDVDVLEVGYVGRGGVGLEYHLRTWDLLTARGLYLYGNGVSDAHGSAWGPRMRPNHFATWIWSEGRDARQLIDSIRRGRMVFGDPFIYPGHLFFRVGSSEMGDRSRVLQAPQRLEVGVDQAFDPSEHRLYLVQGRIRPSRKRVSYLTGDGLEDHRRQLLPGAPLEVDVSRPCFLRLELYDRHGRPLRFTNPIVFDREAPEPA